MGENATQSIPWDQKDPLASAWSISDPQVDNKATQTQDSVPDVKGKKKKHLRLTKKKKKIQSKPGFLNPGREELEKKKGGAWNLPQTNIV